MENKTPLIFERMTKIMSDISAIEKERSNTQGSGYKFRGIDDLYNALHPILAKHEVVMLPKVLDKTREERATKAGGLSIYTLVTVQYTFLTIDGTKVECVTMGEGFDSGDKSVNKAMSGAQKYALLQTFCIPTKEEKDSEGETPEVLPLGFSQEPHLPLPAHKPPVSMVPRAETPAPPDAAKSKKPVTEGQIKRLYAIMNGRKEYGWHKETAEDVAISAFGLKESLSELTMYQYDKLVDWIEKTTYADTIAKITAWAGDKAAKK